MTACQPFRLMIDFGENNVVMINEAQSSHVPLILLSDGTIAPRRRQSDFSGQCVLAVLWASVGYPWEGGADRRRAKNRRSDEVDLGRLQVEEVAQPAACFRSAAWPEFGTANEGREAIPQSAHDVRNVVTMGGVAEQRVLDSRAAASACDRSNALRANRTSRSKGCGGR